jgi:hypothetical protein
MLVRGLIEPSGGFRQPRIPKDLGFDGDPEYPLAIADPNPAEPRSRRRA